MNEIEKPKDPVAAALSYNGSNAPRLVAKGRGAVADQIIAIAQEHGIYLHEDPVLSDCLQRLELNQEIPEKLYIAIARIIAFAYFIKGKTPGSGIA